MTFAAVTDDERLLPKILNVAARFACRTQRVAMRTEREQISLHLEFTGDDDALRRLRAQLNKLIANDKECYS